MSEVSSGDRALALHKNVFMDDFNYTAGIDVDKKTFKVCLLASRRNKRKVKGSRTWDYGYLWAYIWHYHTAVPPGLERARLCGYKTL